MRRQVRRLRFRISSRGGGDAAFDVWFPGWGGRVRCRFSRGQNPDFVIFLWLFGPELVMPQEFEQCQKDADDPAPRVRPGEKRAERDALLGQHADLDPFEVNGNRRVVIDDGARPGFGMLAEHARQGADQVPQLDFLDQVA